MEIKGIKDQASFQRVHYIKESRMMMVEVLEYIINGNFQVELLEAVEKVCSQGEQLDIKLHGGDMIL